MRRRFALFLLCAFAACADPSLSQIADQYAHQTGITYASCGSATLDNGPTCAENNVDDCLTAAFASCAPSRAQVTAYTVEGDPIYSEVFVEPALEGCRVVQIIDTRADAFGAHAVTRSRCLGLAESSCFKASPNDCTVEKKY